MVYQVGYVIPHYGICWFVTFSNVCPYNIAQDMFFPRLSVPCCRLIFLDTNNSHTGHLIISFTVRMWHANLSTIIAMWSMWRLRASIKNRWNFNRRNTYIPPLESASAPLSHSEKLISLWFIWSKLWICEVPRFNMIAAQRRDTTTRIIDAMS